MKMKKILYFIVVVIFITIWYSCTKKDRIDHIDLQAPAPAQISNVKIDNNAGGAILTYQVPIDPNLLYVKAVYEIQPGVFREAKSSIFKDTLFLEGFGDTLSHEVKIYSVGKNEKVSEPFSISVKPLLPPVKSVFKDVDIVAVFGGVKVTFKNSLQAKLSIVVMVDSTGQNNWAPVTTFYTGASTGSFSVRGYDPLEKRFAVYVRDRWNNKSDTLIKALIPLFEQLIPKSGFSAVKLPTDTYQYVENDYMEKLWDGSLQQDLGIFATLHTSFLPQWVTIDLGQKVMLSRMKEFQRTGYEYAGAAVKSFEIWGSNAPDINGGWTNWVLMGTFNSFKPSGSPMGTKTIEDSNYASFLGEDFDFDVVPTVRYIRFKTTETYGGGGQVVIAELTFWGQIVP